MAQQYIGKDVQPWRFDMPAPLPPGFEPVYKAADYQALFQQLGAVREKLARAEADVAAMREAIDAFLGAEVKYNAHGSLHVIEAQKILCRMRDADS